MELNEFLSELQNVLSLELFSLQDTPVTISSLVVFLFSYPFFSIWVGLFAGFCRGNF